MKKANIKLLKKSLARLLRKEALKKGRFVLSSGKISNYYLDGRVITLTAEGAYLVVSIILEMIKGRDIQAIGGPTLGADPIVGAIAAISHLRNLKLKTFIVRKAAKGHGTQRQIEGPALNKKDKVILVDDVATTGKAILEAKEALANIGITAKDAIVIVDRQEGASENLRRAGLRLKAIFKIRELGIKKS